MTDNLKPLAERRAAWIKLLRQHAERTPEGLRLDHDAVVALADLLDDTRASPLPAGEVGGQCRHEPYQGECVHCGIPFRYGQPFYGDSPSPATERESLERAALKRIAATDREDASASVCLDLIDIATEALASTPPQPEAQVSGDLAEVLTYLRRMDDAHLATHALGVGCGRCKAADTIEHLTAQVARKDERLTYIAEAAERGEIDPMGEDIAIKQADGTWTQLSHFARQAISNEGEGKL